MMEKMQIIHLEKRCYRELSGGQQQRVLFARALCATRKILLLDEPTAGLDPKVTKEMYQLIYELNQRDKLTIVMISHDLRAALTYSSHILHTGKHVFFGTKEERIYQTRKAQEYKKAARRYKVMDKLILYFQYPFVRYAMIVGVLIAMCSSLLVCVTLVLKRFSFIGDGLSHVALERWRWQQY